ncbi:MAG TPA: hypothetical protein VLX91_03985 [Candidatus Acidoferrales bacterium]|nr:hypothetical protein [Candidatus Acidoferrales bacterium]
MKYENRIVAFIDILGFKAIVGATLDEDGNEVSEKIKTLNDTLLLVRHEFDMDEPDTKLTKSRQVTQFSDSVVISFLAQEPSEVFYILLDLLHLVINFVGVGVLCRGGIAFGKLIHTDKVLFGPALIKAYETETRAALFPRIILSDYIIALGAKYHLSHHDPADELDSILDIVTVDTDGMYYIDYFTNAQSELNDPAYDMPEYITRLRKIIKEMSQHDEPDIVVKFGWMKDKFNKLIDVSRGEAFIKRLKKSGNYELAEFYSKQVHM